MIIPILVPSGGGWISTLDYFDTHNIGDTLWGRDDAVISCWHTNIEIDGGEALYRYPGELAYAGMLWASADWRWGRGRGWDGV